MTNMLLSERFRIQFARFQSLIAAFTNFQEVVAGVWEGYKPRLRQHALGILGVEGWSEKSIGSSAMLQHTIDAIEIQDASLRGGGIRDMMLAELMGPLALR